MPHVVEVYHQIPIYQKRFEATFWLRWQRGSIWYGIRVQQDKSEALHKTKQMIDATLELETIARLSHDRRYKAFN